MLVRCDNCGAPIDVEETTRVAKCRYCEKVNRVASAARVAESTPEDWIAPPQWVPPPEAPADSNVTLNYRQPRAWAWWPLAFAPVMCAVGYGVYTMSAQGQAMADMNAGTVRIQEPVQDLREKLGGGSIRVSSIAFSPGVAVFSVQQASQPEYFDRYVWLGGRFQDPEPEKINKHRGRALDLNSIPFAQLNDFVERARQQLQIPDGKASAITIGSSNGAPWVDVFITSPRQDGHLRLDLSGNIQP